MSIVGFNQALWFSALITFRAPTPEVNNWLRVEFEEASKPVLN